MTSGEKRFARRLETLLEDDYLCWYDIPVGRRRRYPDFIILHPSRGILFLEVKDWKPENLRGLSPGSAKILTPAGMKQVANPIEQARQYSFQVLKILEKDTQLQQSASNYQGRLCMPYGYGVVFTNISRDKFDRDIPEWQRSSLLPSHQIICKEEIAETVDAEAFQERLWGMFNYQFGTRLTLPQIDRIRWHLFPEIRIPESPGLFDLSREGGQADKRESATDKEQDIADIVKIMDIQQEQLARSLGDGHRVIHGVAGSGKTLILAYRCEYLAAAMSKPILVLCFNISLAAKLRAMIGAKGIQDRVQVYHFHDWCGEQLRRYHIDTQKGSEPIWERQVASVIHAVEKSQIPKAQYGALMIDEGHDFKPDWLKLVAQMIDTETNSLLFLYDDAQSIYGQKGSRLSFSLNSVGIQAQGRTTILKLNYRNTREILDFAYRFAKDYLKDGGSHDMQIIEPQAAGKTGVKPVIKQFENLCDQISYSLSCLDKWHKNGVHWQDMAILYPGGEAGPAMFTALKAANVPHTWLASSEFKKKYNPQQDRVSLMAIPSSKGLEFDRVIVLDADFTRNASETMNQDDARLLYVGLTRACAKLLICTRHRNAITNALQHAAT